jgi:parallel beta-helix repeat protein
LVEGNSLAGTGLAGSVGIHLRPNPFMASSRPDESEIIENEVVDFDLGIRGIDVGATQVLGNTPRRSGFYGIAFTSGQATIEDNELYDTETNGIWLGGAKGFVRRNEIEGGDGIAVVLRLGAVAVVEQNVALGNHAGMLTREDSNATVANNTFSSGGTYGIFVDGTAGVTLLDSNVADHNGGNGIEVSKAGSIIRMNTASFNGGYGISAVLGVIDGGGNNAKGNDGPAQCSNVTCI